MKRVDSQWNTLLLGNVKNLLEANGIECFVRNDLATGVGQPAVEVVRLEEILEDVVGVGTEPQLGENRRDLGAFWRVLVGGGEW